MPGGSGGCIDAACVEKTTNVEMQLTDGVLQADVNDGEIRNHDTTPGRCESVAAPADNDTTDNDRGNFYKGDVNIAPAAVPSSNDTVPFGIERVGQMSVQTADAQEDAHGSGSSPGDLAGGAQTQTDDDNDDGPPPLVYYPPGWEPEETRHGQEGVHGGSALRAGERAPGEAPGGDPPPFGDDSDGDDDDDGGDGDDGDGGPPPLVPPNWRPSDEDHNNKDGGLRSRQAMALQMCRDIEDTVMTML
jgi:hypothetical protein